MWKKPIIISAALLVIFLIGFTWSIFHYRLLDPASLEIIFKPEVTETQAEELLKDYEYYIFSLSREKSEEHRVHAFLIINKAKGFLLEKKLKTIESVQGVLFEWPHPVAIIKTYLCNY